MQLVLARVKQGLEAVASNEDCATNDNCQAAASACPCSKNTQVLYFTWKGLLFISSRTLSQKPDTPIMCHNSSKNQRVSIIFDISNCPSTLDTLL